MKCKKLKYLCRNICTLHIHCIFHSSSCMKSLSLYPVSILSSSYRQTERECNLVISLRPSTASAARWQHAARKARAIERDECNLAAGAR